MSIASFNIIEQHVLDSNAGKQLSLAATDVYLRLALKNKCGLEL
jgi:hypothetical protein